MGFFTLSQKHWATSVYGRFAFGFASILSTFIPDLFVWLVYGDHWASSESDADIKLRDYKEIKTWSNARIIEIFRVVHEEKKVFVYLVLEWVVSINIILSTEWNDAPLRSRQTTIAHQMINLKMKKKEIKTIANYLTTGTLLGSFKQLKGDWGPIIKKFKVKVQNTQELITFNRIHYPFYQFQSWTSPLLKELRHKYPSEYFLPPIN